jgi:hypothetical protein
MNQLEAAFATSLLSPELAPPRGLVAPPGAGIARRFAVYRNNVVAGLVRALESRFPVVAKLVGDAFFKAMAQSFAVANPPRSPMLFRYGEAFPSFIEDFAPVDGIPYLADVARLELARGRAYYAADARPLPPTAFSSLPQEALGATTLILHPSVELLTSTFPIISIWQAHRGGERPVLSTWEPEAALVVRPELDVELHRLPPGGFAFIAALAGRASFTKAATMAAKEVPDFDPVQNLALLIDARIGVDLAAVR